MLTVAQAARAASRRRRPEPPQTHAHFIAEIRDASGRLKFRSRMVKNLTTDTASGYTNRRDWQAKAFAGGQAPIASYNGTASASSATSLTNSGASFPTSGQGLAGMLVACGPNASGTGSTAFGVIVSNTSTVLTVDQWWDAGTLSPSTPASTPNATAKYQILPGQFPAMLLAVTSDSTSPAASDTTLASEATTNGFARAVGTYAHTAAASTYTLQKIFTATGSLTPAKYACFGANGPTGGGVMPFESLISSAPVMISGDQLTLTATITIN